MNIYFISLGCDKNLVDSEVMMGILTSRGHRLVTDLDAAEAVVVNSCCFISDAKEESIDTILELGERKQQGLLRYILVAGCLAERYRKEIIEELPEVDALIGTTAFDRIGEMLDQLEAGDPERPVSAYEDLDRLVLPENRRLIAAGEFSANLKIAEGCNKRCTYCVIPYVRGNYRSVPMEDLVADAARLAENGVREINLVAQETTLYGVDLYGKKMLPELLRRLSDIPGIRWIRLLYCYPEEITDELIQAIRDLPKVCHYLDMPIQHASDRVLQAMGRRTTRAEITERIEKIRSEVPDIVIRTTFITGFPGETEEDFKELYDFVDQMELDHVGVFPYSKEEGTVAEKMENQVPDDLKEARKESIMILQQEISSAILADEVGRNLSVLVEGSLPDDADSEAAEEIRRAGGEGRIVYVGRTYRDAPGVDGFLFFESEEELMSGDIVPVRVLSSDVYDLYGVMQEE